MDTVDKKTRSRVMGRIKSQDTGPELLFRKALYARGVRYRLHNKHLPGKPDLVLSKRKAVVFVNGCYWHGHNCASFRMPTSNVGYWKKKIARNRRNDLLHREKLLQDGWRVLTVWECAIAGKRANLNDTISKALAWLNSDSTDFDL